MSAILLKLYSRSQFVCYGEKKESKKIYITGNRIAGRSSYGSELLFE